MLRCVQYRLMVGLTLLMLGGFAGLAWHLYNIQVRRHAELARLAAAYTQESVRLARWRGEFRDRNGRVLAVSAPEKTACLDLEVCGEDIDRVAGTCGVLLKLPCQSVADAIRFARQHLVRGTSLPPRSLVLKHHLTVEEWTAVATAVRFEHFGFSAGPLAPKDKARLFRLQHHLLFATDAETRCYPYGPTVAQLLGFTSPLPDGLGLEGKAGLEKTYNADLAGTAGRCVSEKDAAGKELPLRRSEYRLATNGSNFQLTIDLPLQQMVEQTLYAAMAQAQAKGASAIIMDPRTFEILAMAAVPSFNPQDPTASPAEYWVNPCLGAMYEPGSIAKLFPLAAALEAGLVTLESSVYCEGGQCVIGGVHVKDHAALGMLTVKEAFARSSNIGYAKIGLCLGPLRLYQCMTNFGLGRPVGVPFFGAATGRIISPADKSVMSLTRAAFGQGIAVSQMQMAVAMCVIANDGRLLRPMLVRQIEAADGKSVRRFAPQFVRTVVSPRTAQQVREAFKAVVARGGTATLAASPRYSIGAKTGTAQKANSHGYLPGTYYSSMIGFLPAESPRLVIAVALDEPKNGYYAGTVVAPVFRTLAEQSAARLGIPPDKGASLRGPRVLCEAKPGTSPSTAGRPL